MDLILTYYNLKTEILKALPNIPQNKINLHFISIREYFIKSSFILENINDLINKLAGD
jgi:hypothetical protein